MGDPLSISASVAGLISLAIQVSQLLYTQIQAAKHAPGDAKELLDELQGIASVLKQLEAFLSAQGIHERKFGANSMLTMAIQGCTVRILDIQGRVEKLKTHGVGGIIERGKWFYKQDEHREIVAYLHRSLTIFQLCLSIEGMGLFQKSMHAFAADSKAVYSAIQLLSQNSLDKKDFDKQLYRITELLVPLYETATTMQRFDNNQQERKDQEILDWFGPLNPTAKQADILSRRQPGTGTWMTEHEVFKEWLEGARNRLWCPGMHGAGKTVLTAVIIDYLQREVLSENIGLAFLYCSYNDQPVQNITNIISSLARQLMGRKAPLPQDLTLLFSQHKDRKTRPSLDECRALLVSLINKYTRTFIILDALDETNERDGTRHELIAELKKISATAKILITSRYCTSDEEYFEPSSKIEIRALEADLVAYVGARMVEESRLTKHFKKEPGLAPLVLENVVKQAQGMFLLAELHMDSIVKKQNLKDVKQAFTNLPRSLNNTYEDVMKRISAQEEHDVDLAMKVLSWISYAARPLNILELQHAIATDPSDETFDPDALIDQDILASVCGGLVSIDPETTTVRLIHHTVQEYLERHGDRIFPEARTNIARTCVAYLSFKTFCDGVLSSPQKSETGDNGIGNMLDEYPFLDYAINNWGIHVRGDWEQIMMPEINRLLVNHGGLISLFYTATKLSQLSTYPRDTTDQIVKKDIYVISAVAIFGLETTLEALLEQRNSKDFSHNNAIKKINYEAEAVAFEAATLHDREAAARLIIKSRPGTICAADGFGETIFYKLSKTSNWVAMRLLVEQNANVNTQSQEQSRKGETALTAATRRRADDLMRWLLDNGADDAINETGKTALVAAVSNRNLPNSRLMLEHALHSKRVDAKAKASYVLPALKAAAEVADMSMLEMLFDVIYKEDSSTDIALFDLFDDEGITSPLHSAAQSGHVPTTSFLVEKGLPIDGKSESGWTPLHWAAERGNLDVLLYLLTEIKGEKVGAKVGAKVDLQTAAGQTALHKAATKRDYTDVVATLLKFGASVTARMQNGNTALHIAAEKGNTEVVSLLLGHMSSGADIVNAKGLSAKDLAAHNGHTEVVDIIDKNSGFISGNHNQSRTKAK